MHFWPKARVLFFSKFRFLISSTHYQSTDNGSSDLASSLLLPSSDSTTSSLVVVDSTSGFIDSSASALDSSDPVAEGSPEPAVGSEAEEAPPFCDSSWTVTGLDRDWSGVLGGVFVGSGSSAFEVDEAAPSTWEASDKDKKLRTKWKDESSLIWLVGLSYFVFRLHFWSLKIKAHFNF